ncbi:hypothetical protein [uncultured Dokdonia sp.]|uniref:hypothetical protein n=1 Tax=uncultured Dokdonia sp. TaxID=575653 RepID=UPI0030EC79C5|tara:strand:+ start:10308 stop:10847 length:540 start_codon:yes stop_codon:yes gene_type:complete
MKYNAFYYLFLVLLSLGCSTDDSNTEEETVEYAMTAVINGELYEMNSAFGANQATNSIFTYYPDDEYIFIQGRYSGPLGALELNMGINRDDLVVGTYPVNLSTDGFDTHIDLIDLTNDTFGNPVYENTVSGFIAITFVDESAKVVKGTFEFDTIADQDETSPVNFSITEGTFNYRYDVD